MKKLLNTARRRASAIIAMLLVVLMVTTTMILVLPDRGGSQVQAEDWFEPYQEQTHEQVQIITGVASNFEVKITSDQQITNENLNDFVFVTDIRDIPIDVSVRGGGGYFAVLPPAGLYRAGHYYTIFLNHAEFYDERLQGQNYVTFRIYREETLDVYYNDSVREIPDSRVISVSDYRLELVNDLSEPFLIGDMLLVTDPRDDLAKTAFRVDDIVSNNGRVSVLRVSQPYMQDLFERIQIYGTSSPSIGDIEFYCEDEIMRQVLNTEDVQALSSAVYTLADSMNMRVNIEDESVAGLFPLSGSGNVGGGLSPNTNRRGVPSSVRLNVNIRGFSPIRLSVSVTVIWELEKEKMQHGNLMAQIRLNYSVDISVQNINNIDSDANIYSSGTITTSTHTVSLAVMVSASTDFSQLEAERLAKRQNKKDNMKVLQQRLVGGAYTQANALLSFAKDGYSPRKDVNGNVVNDRNGNPIFDPVRGNKANNNIGGTHFKDPATGQFRERLGLDLDRAADYNMFYSGVRYQHGLFTRRDNVMAEKIKKALVGYAETYKMAASNPCTSMISFVNIPIPIYPPKIMAQFRVGFIISINFRASLEGTFRHTTVRSEINVTTEDGTTNFNNTKTTISLSLMYNGHFEIRLGLGIEFRVTIAKIFFVSVMGEAGVYFEMSGSAGVHVGFDIGEGGDEMSLFIDDDEELARLANASPFIGHGRIEFGWYVALTISAGLRINLVLFTINISATYTWSHRQPIWRTGQSSTYFSDLVFEHQLGGRIPQSEVRAAIDQRQNLEDPLQFGMQFIAINSAIPSLEIVMEQDEFSVELPQLFRRTINFRTGLITYEPVTVGRLRFDYLDSMPLIICRTGHVGRSSSVRAAEEIITVTAVDRYGELMCESEFAFFTVYLEPIPVESVDIFTSNDDPVIFADDEITIFSAITPHNASFPQSYFEVVSVVSNGRIITYNLDSFAYFMTQGGTHASLRATSRLSPGDEIVVRAVATVDNVESNHLTIRVIRRPVDYLSLTTQNRQTSVVIGQDLYFEVFVNQRNATFNLEGGVALVELLDYRHGVIENLGNGQHVLRVANDNLLFGEVLRIRVSALDGDELTYRYFSFMIQWMPIDYLIIVNHLGVELESITSLNQGQRIFITPVASPLEATVLTRIQLLTNTNSRFINVTPQGELIIDRNTPIGYEFMISARYNGINSRNYRFIVDAIPIEALTLYEYNNRRTLLPLGEARVRVSVYPANATFFDPVFTIIEGSQWATVSSTGIVRMNANSPIGARVVVQATMNGTTSNTHEFMVPAVGMIIISPTNVLTRGDRISLYFELQPTQNSIVPVEFSIESGYQFATITTLGTLSINNDVNIPNARIGVVATILGVRSQIVYFDVIVPVYSVEIYSIIPIANMMLGSTAALNARVNPTYSSVSQAEFRIVYNERYATIDQNGTITISSSVSAIGAVISVVAIVDGVVSPALNIRITRIPVMHIEWATDLDLEMQQGRSMTLSARAYPEAATYRNVVYRIESGLDLAMLNGNVLTILSTAQVGRVLTIIATADGVQSEVLRITIIPVGAEEVTLTRACNSEFVLPGQVINFSALVLPHDTTFPNATFALSPASQAFAQINSMTGVLTVNPAYLIDRGNVVIEVFAIADGVRSNTIRLPIYVAISTITLSFNNTSGANTRIEPGAIIDLTALTNPNATNPSQVVFSILMGGAYAQIIGNQLIINALVTNPNARVTVTALPASNYNFVQEHGLNIASFNIYVPVLGVSFSADTFEVMLGETITLTTPTVIPQFATNAANWVIQFVNPNGTLTQAPHGVTLDGLSIRILDSATVLNNPHFHIRVRAGGRDSHIQRFDIIPRPVRYVVFDDGELNRIRTNGRLEVNPDTSFNDLIRAQTNTDATHRRVIFTVQGVTSYDIDINAFNNEAIANLRVHLSASIHNVIVITARSVSNPNAYSTIRIYIVPIYATEIAGFRISAQDTSRNNQERRTIMNGDYFANVDGREGNLINPSDMVRIEELFFDNELIRDSQGRRGFNNVTFRNHFEIINFNTNLATLNSCGRSFTVLSRENLLNGIIATNNNRFTVTVRLSQDGSNNLTRTITFIVFVSIQTVQFVHGYDSIDSMHRPISNSSGNSFRSVLDGTQINVNRQNNIGRQNVFAFAFTINNASYATNRAHLHHPVFKYINGTRMGEYGGGVSMRIEGNMNVIFLELSTWHTYGTSFLVVIRNPDYGVQNGRDLFSFRMRIVERSSDETVAFGFDRNIIGAQVPISQVRMNNNVTPIRGSGTALVRNYIDLIAGRQVPATFSNGLNFNSYGISIAIVSSDSSQVEIYRGQGNSLLSQGRVYLRALAGARDSFNANRLIRISVTFEDGTRRPSGRPADLFFYVRVVRPASDRFMVIPGGQMSDTTFNVRAFSTDMSQAVRIASSYYGTLFTPNFRFVPHASSYANVSLSNGRLVNGRTLTVQNPNAMTWILGRVYFDIRLPYNGSYIDVEGVSRQVQRRFVNNVNQFLDLGFLTTGDGDVSLLNSLNLAGRVSGNQRYFVSALNVMLLGNGNTISNINISTPNTSFSSEQSGGLFGRISANAGVTNLTLTGVNATSAARQGGSYYLFGALAGVNYGHIQNVSVSGIINMDRRYSTIGGVVGRNNGSIINATNHINITASGNIGGVVGQNTQNGWVSRSWQRGRITYRQRRTRSVGGVVGWNQGWVYRCNSSGDIGTSATITDPCRVGGIVGHNTPTARFCGTGSWGTGLVYFRRNRNNVFLFTYLSGRVGRLEGYLGTHHFANHHLRT